VQTGKRCELRELGGNGSRLPKPQPTLIAGEKGPRLGMHATLPNGVNGLCFVDSREIDHVIRAVAKWADDADR
jgi:hypothetical protein